MVNHFGQTESGANTSSLINNNKNSKEININIDETKNNTNKMVLFYKTILLNGD